jgi:dTDP-4-dehydrorhamnose 3,5-epimerase
MVIPSLELDFTDFQPDAPIPHPAPAEGGTSPDMIHGVSTRALVVHADERGSLCELLTTRDEAIEPIVHVYQVTAAPGAVRAWVYHRFQNDRLAFTEGRFRVALYDIRPNSPSCYLLNEFVLGREQPTLLRIPPYVIHGVQNIGHEASTFVNLPTKVYQPGAPDKCRIDASDIRVPFCFDGFVQSR